MEWTLPQQDGLAKAWNYPKIYVHPPYGADRERRTTIKNGLSTCATTRKQYQAEILALIPVAVNTSHWKQSVFGQATAVCFLYDTRLKFLENGKDGGKGAPMDGSMIYWGENYKRFYNIFIKYGAVVDISHLIGINIGTTK